MRDLLKRFRRRVGLIFKISLSLSLSLSQLECDRVCGDVTINVPTQKRQVLPVQISNRYREQVRIRKGDVHSVSSGRGVSRDLDAEGRVRTCWKADRGGCGSWIFVCDLCVRSDGNG